MKRLTIGLLGFGQIGSQLYAILQEKKAYFRKEIGVDLHVKVIGERDTRRKRRIKLPTALVCRDAFKVVQDPAVDVIVELVGGTRIARSLVLEALKQGKHVVTANKALLAEHGDEIFAMANRMNRWIFFEAAVGGGMPIMKTLREGLVANRIDSIYTIINGTSNYILTRMSQAPIDFKEALKEAQELGYAEADPTLDIDGTDVAHKLALLARFAFGGKVRFDKITKEGISRIGVEDVEFAHEFGYRVKLLAIAKRHKDGIEARVQLTLLPENHILANVNGSFNAMLVRGDKVGDILVYGRGAGPNPTASAVISDLVDLAMLGDVSPAQSPLGMRFNRGFLKVKSLSSILSRYYLRFHVLDKPGVMSKITRVLGAHKISISDCMQKERSQGNAVPLIILTHDAHERNVRNAIQAIDKLAIVKGKSQVIRMEEAPRH